MENSFTDNLTLVFSGSIDEKKLPKLINDVEKWLKQYNEKTNIKRKIVTISLEFLQNIILHSCEKSCTFILKKEGAAYNIIAGSWIMSEQIRILKQEVDKINHYSQKQLDKEIDEKLSSGLIEKRKGAGIGLLYSREIASGEIKLREIQWDKMKSLVRIEANVNKQN